MRERRERRETGRETERQRQNEYNSLAMEALDRSYIDRRQKRKNALRKLIQIVLV